MTKSNNLTKSTTIETKSAEVVTSKSNYEILAKPKDQSEVKVRHLITRPLYKALNRKEVIIPGLIIYTVVVFYFGEVYDHGIVTEILEKELIADFSAIALAIFLLYLYFRPKIRLPKFLAHLMK